MHGGSDIASGARPAEVIPPLVHELKSALANVVHSGELLADELVGPLSPQQREVAGILRENSRKLQLLIEYLTAYDSWRDRVRGQVTASRFPLKPLLERWVQRYRPLGAAYEVRIDLECAGRDVDMDSVALCLILDNLLAHALQVSPRGASVKVDAVVNGGALHLTVTDQGPRIAAADHPGLLGGIGKDLLIWKGDRKAGGKVERAGLAVARDCAQALGGQLEILEAMGEGARFRVSLPLQEKMTHAH